MYRIRFHGRGGQGMKTASRILGTAFFLEGFEVQDAQRYGAERRGAPIFAYVRADRTPIDERGVIDRPDLVVVADDTLVPVPAAGVMQGIGPKTVVLIDSPESAATWRQRLNLPGSILVLPRAKPLEPSQMAHVGTECAGAAASLTGVISRPSVERAVRQELAQMKTDVVDKNVDIANRAYDCMAGESGIVREGGTTSHRGRAIPNWVNMPADDIGESGPAIYGEATSIAVRTGLWRSMRPVVDTSRCNRCTWICGSFCPDSAITPGPDGYPQIDLDHCKGCMICVAQCPPHAIEAIPEAEATAMEKEGTAP